MASEQKEIYGYVEKVTLIDKNMTLSAKLDTGAKSSSLSAIDIKEIIKQGKRYLMFTVPNKLQKVTFISEYLGKVRIKARTEESAQAPDAKVRPIRRSVVMMRIKLGNQTRTIAVNLTNRQRFNYPLLLGREAIIAFGGTIDPSKAFITVVKNEA